MFCVQIIYFWGIYCSCFGNICLLCIRLLYFAHIRCSFCAYSLCVLCPYNSSFSHITFVFCAYVIFLCIHHLSLVRIPFTFCGCTLWVLPSGHLCFVLIPFWLCAYIVYIIWHVNTLAWWVECSPILRETGVQSQVVACQNPQNGTWCPLVPFMYYAYDIHEFGIKNSVLNIQSLCFVYMLFMLWKYICVFYGCHLCFRRIPFLSYTYNITSFVHIAFLFGTYIFCI